mmetsp:Transcript_65324/g.156153  ORF Transcript_65324/g.156153 Transcript_65324/m.156153 type:complete len:214 (+) Transcript_65324:777-1418(+)
MLHIPVQKLVHDVHHIRQASDLTDLLEAIFSCLALLRLFEDDLLQAIPYQLLDGEDLLVAAGNRLEGLGSSLHRYLVSPPFKVLPSSDVLFSLLQSVFKVINCLVASNPFIRYLGFSFGQFQHLFDLRSMSTPAFFPPLVRLSLFATGMVMQDGHLLFHDVPLVFQAAENVPLHLRATGCILQLLLHFLQLVLQVLTSEPILQGVVLCLLHHL